MGNKEMIMHVGLAGLDNTYSVGVSNSSQTDVAVSASHRGTISSFRTPGRGVNNIFRGQVGGEACNDAGVYNCSSEFSARVENRAVGLEGIFASGPFKLVGEYSAGDYKGASNNGNTVSYDTKTYYVETGWFITGEKYASSYKNGTFSSFKPINEFDLDKGNLGAIEALFRAEAYDVDNLVMSGASTNRVQGNLSRYHNNTTERAESRASGTESGAKTYTAGVRWILNPNVVVKGNYSYTRFDNVFAPIDITSSTRNVSDEKLFMIRTQYMF
jgi:phosphate-selective porin OprO/OprP